MNADRAEQQMSSKSLLIVLGCILAAAAIAFGGYKIYDKVSSRPLTPAETREAVTKYLKKRSNRSSFETSLEPLKKEKRPWDILEKQYDSVPDYETVYRRIGEHLWIADQWLKSTDKKEQRAGARTIMAAVDAAHDVAVDDWLACRICDAYLVPIFTHEGELTDEEEQLMHFAARRYNDADETEKEIEIGKYYLTKVGSNRRGDSVRYRLARLLQNKGQHEEAKKILQQINTGKTNALSQKKLERVQQATNATTTK